MFQGAAAYRPGCDVGAVVPKYSRYARWIALNVLTLGFLQIVFCHPNAIRNRYIPNVSTYLANSYGGDWFSGAVITATIIFVGGLGADASLIGFLVFEHTFVNVNLVIFFACNLLLVLITQFPCC